MVQSYRRKNINLYQAKTPHANDNDKLIRQWYYANDKFSQSNKKRYSYWKKNSKKFRAYFCKKFQFSFKKSKI